MPSPITGWVQPRRPAAHRPVTLTVGPFDGVANTLDVASVGPNELSHLYNGYLPRGGQVVAMRPPYARRVVGAGTGWHALHFHTDSTGTTRLFGVRGAVLYRINTTTWALTDVTPAATTVGSGTYLHSFGDELIVTNGSDRPWRGSALGATPITKTNIQVDSASTAWAAYGPPTTYYGKLFFVRNDDRTKFVWSEEGAAGTGYEQTGYSDYWDFAQTSQEPIVRLVGTNDALYVFRARSISAVYGAADSSFSTAGTHDGISPEVGLSLATAVTETARGLWFVGSDAYAHLLPPGGRPERLPNLSSGTAAAVLAATAFAFGLPDHGMVAFVAVTAMADTSYTVAVVNAETGRCEGAWGSSLAQTISAAAYGEGLQVIGDSNGSLLSIAPQIYGDSPYESDGLSQVGYGAVVVLPPFQTDPARVIRGREPVAWTTADGVATTQFTVDYQTSESDTTAAQAVTLATPVTTRTGAARVGLGASAQGRWVRVRVRKLSTDLASTFGLVDATLRGVVVDDRGAR